MAALVAVMIMVSISTFNWGSITNIRKVPKNETAVMITTVLITVLTHNLAIGVLIGVAMSAIFFSRKIANLIHVDSYLKEQEKERIYSVNGQVFFVSVDSFLSSFDFREKLERVIVDLTHAHLWDHSAVDAVDKVVLRYRKRGVEVELIGLNEASATLLERLATHDQPDALDKMGNH
ncbi:MAG: STAS domain-containing protein [Crocosphaera sp.]|nr:STAS domain-containing protein [Crocosphaera sp.]